METPYNYRQQTHRIVATKLSNQVSSPNNLVANSRISHTSSSSSSSSRETSTIVSPLLAALNADIAAVYHGGPIREAADMAGANDIMTTSASRIDGGDAVDDAGNGMDDVHDGDGDNGGVVRGNSINGTGTAAAAGDSVGISAAMTKIPLAERKQQVM